MSIRDHYLGSYGVFCIVAGSLVVAVGVAHIVAWLFVLRKEERIAEQAEASVPPVLALDPYNASVPQYNTFSGPPSDLEQGAPAMSPSLMPTDTDDAATRRALEAQLRAEAEVVARREADEEERQMIAEMTRRSAAAADADRRRAERVRRYVAMYPSTC
jgi:type IV secretory pathway VirB10-like protein